jgi:hypothetical protein
MVSNPENRDKTRFHHKSPVALENSNMGLLRGARMYNYSDMGLYIEADYRLEPQTEVRVEIANSPFASEPYIQESYRGVIRWRSPLKRSIYHYGYGIELLKDNGPVEYPKAFNGSRSHPRLKCAIGLKFEFNGGTYDGFAENVSNSGVYIKTREPAIVGHPITVYIPAKKAGKIKKLNGRVAWSNPVGMGVKFERSIEPQDGMQAERQGLFTAAARESERL